MVTTFNSFFNDHAVQLETLDQVIRQLAARTWHIGYFLVISAHDMTHPELGKENESHQHNTKEYKYHGVNYLFTLQMIMIIISSSFS